MFDKLTFASPKEKEDFEKYKKLKGVYFHKQVYDILIEANGEENVTYSELSSIIRYDKNLDKDNGLQKYKNKNHFSFYIKP